ncbi:MAG: rod shape-determining protein RodA [Rhodospirillaceae bacterium]
MARNIWQDNRLNPPELTLAQRILQINWLLLFLVSLIALIGLAMLYSAANGSWSPWAVRQAIRFAMALALCIAVAIVDIRFWLRWAYLSYAISMTLLIGVEVMGEIGMGAQRWIDLGLIRLQPSELMKISLVLALARYFHGRTYDEIGQIRFLLMPLLAIIAPVILVLRQPDLGTALMLVMGGATIFFLAGVRLWKFGIVGMLSLASVPIAWQFLRDYQKKRVLTFLDPESDPLGAGYHILQSKIALGSGGTWGKGFLQGSQSHLNFLPEKQTDFIFTMLAEELGMIGGLALIGLYMLVIAYGFIITLRCRNRFGRLNACGMTTSLFLYVFINIAMVMGLLPVVGVPLPLISYGGTVMLTVMIGLGFVINAYIHRDLEIPRRTNET